MIHMMPQLLANQIAAGEVVERPASVIKECIENSLDAHATSIEVMVENAGSQYISIKDNGCGIEKDELDLAICRHATSKIECIEDLEKLQTMGFRGEALASITSVAAVKLSSRTRDQDTGWCLKTHGGEMQDKSPVVMSVGTRIEVEDLFYNTPARRRFMRTLRTEMSHIEDIFKRLSLSRPDVEMKLIHQDKVVRHYPLGVDILDQDDRLKALMGAEWASHAIPITSIGDGIKITGWVTRPPYARSQADLQYLFVNGRSIKDYAFSHAVKRSMSDLLYQDKHPSWVLYLEVDPSRIDVNIHPTKDRVRFSEASWVYDWVYKTMRGIFRPAQVVESPSQSASDFLKASIGLQKVIDSKASPVLPNLWDSVKAPLSSATTREEMSLPHMLATATSETPAQITVSEGLKYTDSTSNDALSSYMPPAARSSHIQAFCQIDGAFLLGMCNEDIWIVDIHAAHERQVMEDLLIKFKDQGLHTDQLLIPIAVEDGSYSSLIAEHQDLLHRYGFQSELEDDKWFIHAHPRGLKVSEALQVFMSLLNHIQHDLLVVEPEMLMSEIIADIACHMAVNVSRTMTRLEMQHFLENIQSLVEVCNHGRPWKWKITPNELNKYFMRGQ